MGLSTGDWSHEGAAIGAVREEPVDTGKDRRNTMAFPFLPPSSSHWPNPDRSQPTQDPGKFSLLWCRAGMGKELICGLTRRGWHISQLTKKKKKNSNPSLSRFHKTEWWILLGLRTRTMHDLYKKANYDRTKITPPNTNMEDVTRKTMRAEWMIMRGKRPYWSGWKWLGSCLERRKIRMKPRLPGQSRHHLWRQTGVWSNRFGQTPHTCNGKVSETRGKELASLVGERSRWVTHGLTSMALV